MTIQYKRKGGIVNSYKDVRHVAISDAIRLCDERIKNTFNIPSVDIDMWLELKKKLENIS